MNFSCKDSFPKILIVCAQIAAASLALANDARPQTELTLPFSANSSGVVNASATAGNAMADVNDIVLAQLTVKKLTPNVIAPPVPPPNTGNTVAPKILADPPKASGPNLGGIAGKLVQIQDMHVSSSSVNLTGATTTLSVTVNSQAGPCVAGIYVNGQEAGILTTKDSVLLPGAPAPESLTLTFNAPGTYQLVAHQASWIGPHCTGEAKATVVVSADSNWPCSIYAGYIKETGGLLMGPGQFICRPANMAHNVAKMQCPSGTIFMNVGAVFGCVSQAFFNIATKGN